MNTTIVICSANRPAILAETVDSIICSQLVPAREILIAVYDDDHVEERTKATPNVRVILSPTQGTCAQRNAAAKRVQTPYTLFLDDDVELAPNFIESMEQIIGQADEVVGATAFLVADGAEGDKGLERNVAKSYTASYKQTANSLDPSDGRNLIVRTRLFHHVLFDEKLPLYGWLEDFDFVTNLARFGLVIKNRGTCAAHLRVSSGRTSGLRFGYSQIANPLYLWKKNGQPHLAHVIFRHWLLHLASNMRRAAMKRASDRTDGTGRFKGNMIALGHFLGGKIDPSYILRM